MVDNDCDFALLTCSTQNIGDYIQTIAARRLLPRVDHLVDRDRLADFRPRRPTKLICNGWFGYRPQRFGFHANVEPLLISMHISTRTNLQRGGDALAFADVLRAVPELRFELSRFSPVGVRDLSTLRLLQSLDIAASFSGCLTLTLERQPDLPRGDETVLCDVPPAMAEHLEKIIEGPVRAVHHTLPPHQPPETCFAEADQRLRTYQMARLVITSRLHTALPCVAYGTPVIWIRHDFEAERFEGLTDFMTVVSADELARLRRLDLSDFPKPIASHLALRDALITRVGNFIAAPPAITEGRCDDALSRTQALAEFYERHASHLRDELIVVQDDLARRHRRVGLLVALRSRASATAARLLPRRLMRRLLGLWHAIRDSIKWHRN